MPTSKRTVAHADTPSESVSEDMAYGDPPKTQTMEITPASPKRNRAAEAKRANDNQIERMVDLAVARHNQSLGDEYIKLAQAMILCSLPHSATDATKLTRRARLGDGSTLSVTFTAAAEGVGLPYGADRKLLFWLLDRAIRTDSPFVPWSTAREFQDEVGLAPGGHTNADLRKRFARISGVAISITRKGSEAVAQNNFFLVERSYLPKAINGKGLSNQQSLPDMEGYGILLHSPLFADIKKHNTVMPRRLWLEIKGPTAVQDLVFWLYWRCYSAASETIIPWSAIIEQFGQEDSNERRTRQHVRKAVHLLLQLWPQAKLKEVKQGLWIDRASAPMLDDDVMKNRVRRL